MVRQGNPGARGAGPEASPGARTGKRPAGTPGKAVYRRRRIFAAAVLLLVAGLAVAGFTALTSALSGGPAAAPATTPAGREAAPATTGPAASATATPTAGTGCDQKLLTVTAATDKRVYAAGENPLLSLKVTNNNEVPCEVNLGTSQMEYLVTSGSDRIFSSLDCQAESTELVKTIAPGRSETANFPWNRKRSTQGCKVVDAEPGGGGAYYVFTARLGNKTSPKAVFQLS
ncbi:hypothetical protein [Arthrobacter sp. Soil763]|uniref:hypothetical protein n=1 Tax=Arthrobacter sp. Soil763 TaxID=1736402 RepID=UPI000700EDAC|nr:hypothetical protein [Arthrobacter sp. Soil763]KRE81841.1 hypothetical protein ASG71_01925 [Arthrobacter sp. Soil763]